MTDITDLITRLESTTEGSRELDWAVRDQMFEFGVDLGHPEPFTLKIDAALMLLPKHYSFELTASATEDFAPGSFTRCRLWDWRRGPKMADPNNEWVGEGNRQLPLNIVIAALRARHSSTDSPYRR